MAVMRFFRPIKGCRIFASAQNPHFKEMDYVGEVIRVDGNFAWFTDRAGDTDLVIWRFEDGVNKFILFGA